MKRIVLSMVLLFACAFLATAQDAASIMKAARKGNESGSMGTRDRMVVMSKNGTTKEMVIDQFSKDGPNGSRIMIVFNSPAGQKGTRFLSMENGSGATDQWIFLPSLGKSRRIASSESGGSFMGTDFSYDDMSLLDREAGDDRHSIVREETLGGAVCYVIQSIPNAGDYQYSKTVSWVDKTSNRIYKTELYDKKGALVKLLEMSDYQDVQGRDTSKSVKISTIAAGTSTTIYMDRIEYDMKIPDGVFSTAYLETGRTK
ncbi:MAG: outer membrane lipoprotein-sorting protein [Clostridiales bacterium]|jgi:outer membrane lipoprotein-sorting protein|nr:outer membrane lipoprotein-sorting protein [Clostridiales bacterium]